MEDHMKSREIFFHSRELHMMAFLNYLSNKLKRLVIA